MCQHPLCDHGSAAGSLSSGHRPVAPSCIGKFLSTIKLLCIVGVLAWLLHLCPFAITLVLPLLCALLVGLVINASMQRSSQLTPEQRHALHSDPDHQQFMSDAMRNKVHYATRLGQAIQLPTVSFDEHDIQQKTDPGQFLKLHELLQKNYPLVHEKLERTVINNYSLVYKWKATSSSSGSSSSSSPSPRRRPILLAAHLDVVPVPDGHLWAFDPFGGEMNSEGFICGRGAIDDKHALCGLLESCEALLEQGWCPTERDIYLAFGHDEEISGYQGAGEIAKYFKQQELSFEWMLDEGLFVMKDMLPGLKESVAMVCVAEKGFLVSELKVNVPASLAGHASAPSSVSAIGILSEALLRMESNPMPSYLLQARSPVRQMFRALAPHFSWPLRILLGNLALPPIGWILAKILERKNTTATIVRTTTALTVFQAGGKANVVPREARALLNHRIHPFDSVRGVLDYTRRIINDSRVQLKDLRSLPPSALSATRGPGSEGFEVLRQAIGRTMPEVLVAPALMVGNTDTHHYWGLVENIYRFSPSRMTPDSVSMFHGVNERIHVDNYVECIGFYRSVIRMAGEPQPPTQSSSSTNAVSSSATKHASSSSKED